MRNKCGKAFLCVLLCLLFCAVPVLAADEAAPITDGILGKRDVQTWIDGELSGQPAVSEWYILTLRQYGTYDLSGYERALTAYLRENTVRSASSRQKYALALLACGSTDAYITATLNDSIGQQGLMSWVFGLHLLNNGCESGTHSVQTVTAQLLSLQHGDGGWSVSGAYGDADATAMVIQALAPQYGQESSVTAAVDNGLRFLSAAQRADGDYASYGVTNAESTAQVIIALSSVGIDAATDTRFIKNGATLFDGLRHYRLPDGRYCHQRGGAANDTATVQALAAAVAYQRFENGKPSLYLLDARRTAAAPTDYRPWATAAIAALAGIACVVLLLVKQRKNVLIVLLIAAVLIAAVWLVTFQTPDEHYAGDDEAGAVIGTVTLSIRCDSIADKSAAHIPDDGVLLAPAAVTLREGDTVYDVLLGATAARKLHLETSGGYVQGIGNIYEFDHGDLSGWLYFVNGENVNESCSRYLLSDGDTVEWKYTCHMGEDLK